MTGDETIDIDITQAMVIAQFMLDLNIIAVRFIAQFQFFLTNIHVCNQVDGKLSQKSLTSHMSFASYWIRLAVVAVCSRHVTTSHHSFASARRVT